MVNKRFSKPLAQMGRKEFLETFNRMQKYRPEGLRVPSVVMIPPKQWKDDRELPFAPGDRVQIIAKGEHKLKVGTVMYRFPQMGNAFAVAGVPGAKMVNPVEMKKQVGEENYEPVSDTYSVFDYKDLRLVSKMRLGESGAEQDVAFDSVSLGPERYNPLTNTHQRVRYATHAPSMVIPWPGQQVKPVEAEKAQLTTPAEIADTRTHYVTSAVEAPLPLNAIPQITNLNNRYKRGRYAPRITEAEAARYRAPTMPAGPRTRKLLEQLEKMPKPPQPEWTAEMEEFIGAEVRKGLQKRLEEERQALKSYT